MNDQMVFNVHQDNSDQFYWELRQSDDLLATSGEPYDDFGDALAGLYVFRERASGSPINDRTGPGGTEKKADAEFEIYEDEDGGLDWNFQQSAGEPLASGVAHPDRSRIEGAIERVQEEAGTAEVTVEALVPVDIESCAKRGHEPPRAQRYRIGVDREKYVVESDKITGREILQLAGKTPPSRWRLDQQFGSGETKKIELDDTVDVCEPGVEHFMTIPLDQREGQPAADAATAAPEARRQFDLPAKDRAHLEARGLPWETLLEGRRQWLLVHEFPVPKGYNCETVSVALRVPEGYPTAKIAMAYFSPALKRADGTPVPQTQQTKRIDGERWQRWSRHRTNENPWRPGVDCVATHLALIEDWLEREFRA